MHHNPFSPLHANEYVNHCSQALTHIAQKLEQLHHSGWVHRDIKPGNILRLPKLHAWTLMDFGCAARAGTTIHVEAVILARVHHAAATWS